MCTLWEFSSGSVLLLLAILVPHGLWDLFPWICIYFWSVLLCLICSMWLSLLDICFLDVMALCFTDITMVSPWVASLYSCGFFLGLASPLFPFSWVLLSDMCWCLTLVACSSLGLISALHSEQSQWLGCMWGLSLSQFLQVLVSEFFEVICIRCDLKILCIYITNTLQMCK